MVPFVTLLQDNLVHSELSNSSDGLNDNPKVSSEWLGFTVIIPSFLGREPIIKSACNISVPVNIQYGHCPILID